MEQFIVSARKYRPQAFESVVGQSHITDTLLKSVQSDHLAQALLFCGPRGVGKTTCARILAKVINSGVELTDDELALNIFELDAASNNSVDDIRRLIDQVRFAPQTGKFKVYIIDEVHMLSQQAFNAFLKTLEEPPAHAIFILATTEKHKIIPTILSRCQIFDFKRITVEDIADHLAYVATQEGVDAEPEALHMIAEKADGALRDALSLFDRMVSFSGDALTYAQVVEVLDILDYDYFFRTVDLAQGVNYPDLLLLYNEVLGKGFNGHEFVVGMSKHFRDLLVAREPKTVQLLEVGPAIKQRYLAQSSGSATRFLLHGLKVFNDLDSQYKMSSQPRILVELGLLKLIEFISQEKKKSRPNAVISRDKSTDDFLPDTLPRRGQSLPEPQSPQKSTVRIVSDENLPEESAVHDSSKKSNTPRADLGSAFGEAPAVQNIEAHKILKQPPSSTKPVAVRKRRKVGSGGLSLMDAMDEMGASTTKTEQSPSDGNDEAAPVAQEGPQSVFNDHELKLAMEVYAKQRHVKTAMRSLFLAQTPKIIDKNTLQINLDNNIQLGYFNDEQKQLVPYLREKLNNYSLRFEIKIIESEQVKKLYLPEEKFKHMAEKNPHLVYLRQKINTDLE